MGNASCTSKPARPHVSSLPEGEVATRVGASGSGDPFAAEPWRRRALARNRSDSRMSLDGAPPISFPAPVAPWAAVSSLAGPRASLTKQCGDVGNGITFAYPSVHAAGDDLRRPGTFSCAPRRALANDQQESAQRPISRAAERNVSRVGCHVSRTDSVRRVICFGYPLVGRNGAKRVEVLLGMRAGTIHRGQSGRTLSPASYGVRVGAGADARRKLQHKRGESFVYRE
jgi:hypothetical protein